MLRLIEVFNAIPHSLPVSPDSEFQPGFIAQLSLLGNQVVATVSNGFSPIGIIDDIKTRAFTSVSFDETVLSPAFPNPPTNQANQPIAPYDIKLELNNPNVLAASFVSIPVPLQLIPRNGVVIFPQGTLLNYDLLGLGYPNAIKTNVRYAYQIPNIIGDDSTVGSNRCTVWLCRMLASTDCYETNQSYPLNANLFVSEFGMLTSRQPYPNSPSVAICIGPPSAIAHDLQFLWL